MEVVKTNESWLNVNGFSEKMPKNTSARNLERTFLDFNFMIYKIIYKLQNLDMIE
jgi:hypothetical protein